MFVVIHLLFILLWYLGKTVVDGVLVLKVTTYVFGIPITIDESYNVCEIGGGCPLKDNRKVNFDITIPGLATNVSAVTGPSGQTNLVYGSLTN